MVRKPRARAPRITAVVTAFALSALAACGDDDTSSATGDPAETVTSESADATTTTEAAEPETVEVTAVDYAFEGLPAAVEAGTEVSLVSGSDTEVHEIVAFRLPDQEQRSADELMELPEAELMGVFRGPPATVLVAPPGEDGFAAVGDGTFSDPGRYLLFCAIPLGADPAAYLAAAQAAQGGPVDVEGGPPHFTQGMFAELEVR